MELLRLKCPGCHSADIKYHSPYTTKNYGGRVIYKCEHCPVYFSETKKTLMEGVKTPVSVIWQVLKARTEGLGLNAAARTFEKAKNTILAWERKFIDLHQVLFLYALVHEFLELVLEGDDFSPRLKPGVSWVRTKQETPNALPTPLAPPFLPIAKARGISEDLDDVVAAQQVDDIAIQRCFQHIPRPGIPVLQRRMQRLLIEETNCRHQESLR